MRLGISIVCFMIALLAKAEDHGIGRITDQVMDLTYVDHVLTGTIADREIHGKVLENEFGFLIEQTAQGVQFESVLRDVDGELKGEIISIKPNGVLSVDTMYFDQIDHATGSITGRIKNHTFSVKVSSDEMNGHHYVSPTFKIMIDDQYVYEFHLAGGQACMGCAIRLSYAVLSILSGSGLL